MNDYLQLPVKELLQPAIGNWYEEERFTDFVPEGSQFAFYPVVSDMNYYRKVTPKSAAQFISVQYKFSVGDPVFDKNIEGIKKHCLLTTCAAC